MIPKVCQNHESLWNWLHVKYAEHPQHSLCSKALDSKRDSLGRCFHPQLFPFQGDTWTMPTLRLGFPSGMYPVMGGWAESWEGGGGKGKVSVPCGHIPKSLSPARGLEPVHQHRAVAVGPQQTALQPCHVSMSVWERTSCVSRGSATAEDGERVELEVSHSTVWVPLSPVFSCFPLFAFPTLLCAQFIDLPWWSRSGDGHSPKKPPLQVVAPASPFLVPQSSLRA